MAVRFKKYFGQCKAIDCNGKKGKHCPEILKNKQNGQQRACGAWVIALFNENHKWVEMTCKDVNSRTEARKRLNMLIADRERGKLSLPTGKRIPTFGEYSAQYLRMAMLEKENTRLIKQRAINALSGFFGSYRLDRISSFMVEKYKLERQEKGLSFGTINLDLAILTHCMNKAVQSGYISNNPCLHVKKLKLSGKVRDRILDDTEIRLIMDNLQGKDKLIVLTSLLTGMRLNEVLALEWSDINFSNGLVAITQTKTGKVLTVPLADTLSSELKRYRETVSANNDRVFETRLINQNLVSKYSTYFSKVFKSLGISDFTFHNLRHTFASLQCQLGTDLITTQGLLGHSNIAMTARYSHSQIEAKRDAIRNLEKSLEGHGINSTLQVSTG